MVRVRRPSSSSVAADSLQPDHDGTASIGANGITCVGAGLRLRRDRVHLLQLHSRIGAAADGGSLSAEQVLGPVADGLAAVRQAGLAEHAGITATGDTEATRHVIESGRIKTAQVYINALNP